MEWTNGEILKRIVALLFALAGLADRSSLAPRPVRDHLLGTFRQAEAIAQAFVIGTARDLGVMMPLKVALDGDDPDDATRLAHSLHALALALASLSARAERPANHGFGFIVAVATIDALRKLDRLTERPGKTAPTPDTS